MADFIRFYGRRPEEFSGPDMLALAYRVAVYGGMIAARIEEQKPRTVPPTTSGEVKMVPPTKAAILADPLLREVIQVG